jgi:hypothetical protein
MKSLRKSSVESGSVSWTGTILGFTPRDGTVFSKRLFRILERQPPFYLAQVEVKISTTFVLVAGWLAGWQKGVFWDVAAPLICVYAHVSSLVT